MGSHKGVLERVLRELGVVVAPEAKIALEALPERFHDWLVQHESVQMPLAAE